MAHELETCVTNGEERPDGLGCRDFGEIAAGWLR